MMNILLASMFHGKSIESGNNKRLLQELVGMVEFAGSPKLALSSARVERAGNLARPQRQPSAVHVHGILRWVVKLASLTKPAVPGFLVKVTNWLSGALRKA